MNTVTLVLVFTEEVQHLHESFVCMWNVGMPFLASTQSRALLTILASMKATVRLYQKYVSVFECLHVKVSVFQVSVFKVSGFKSQF